MNEQLRMRILIQNFGDYYDKEVDIIMAELVRQKCVPNGDCLNDPIRAVLKKRLKSFYGGEKKTTTFLDVIRKMLRIKTKEEQLHQDVLDVLRSTRENNDGIDYKVPLTKWQEINGFETRVLGQVSYLEHLLQDYFKLVENTFRRRGR